MKKVAVVFLIIMGMSIQHILFAESPLKTPPGEEFIASNLDQVKFVFVRTGQKDRSPQRNIYVMDSEGSKPRQILGGPAMSMRVK